MLAPSGLLSWCQRLGIPEQTRTIISHIRSSAPLRRVGGGKSNVSGRYPSRKMGVTIQFESHRVELAGIYEMEHDAAVFEYFDQPPPIKLNYESPGGKPMGVLHTPDFFVIRDGEAGGRSGKQRKTWGVLASGIVIAIAPTPTATGIVLPGLLMRPGWDFTTAFDRRRRSTGFSSGISSFSRTIFEVVRRPSRRPVATLPWRMFRQRRACPWRICCRDTHSEL
ncbi:MAG: Tn7 transposase TnsA N-terminal domain-containing protein [Acidobacteria bacterium]|nr:Tn7 transposase TnsA N-terminal domain-containing protein [Acidobacteriota bacterium]MCI0723882.1 Tn7 transposase TnsA N-terminal domain-containing protein [Acidobacteriota bacterium]